MAKPDTLPSTGVSYMKQIETYSNKISAAWYKARDSIIEVGALLNDAERNLKPLEFRNLKKHLSDNNVMGKSTISKLMTISKSPRVSSPDVIPLLPSSYATLYEIVRLGEDEFKKGISDGIINATMEQQDVRSLASKRSSSPTIDSQSLLSVSAESGRLSKKDKEKLIMIVDELSKIKGISVIKKSNYKKLTSGTS
jgi:hypothetical protein